MVESPSWKPGLLAGHAERLARGVESADSGRAVARGSKADANLTRRPRVRRHLQLDGRDALGPCSEFERRRIDGNDVASVIGRDEIQSNGRTVIPDREGHGQLGSRERRLNGRRNDLDELAVEQSRPDALSSGAGFIATVDEHREMARWEA